MGGQTVVLECGHLDLHESELNLSLGNRQVEVSYARTRDGVKLSAVRIEVSIPDLKSIAEHLGLKIEERGFELTVSDGTVQYSAFTEKGRMLMSGVVHGSR